MKAADYLTKNRDNIIHFDKIKKIIDDLKDHRGNFGKIWEYCLQNLTNIELVKLELLQILKNDETYCVLYHLLNSDFDKKELKNLIQCKKYYSH